MALHLTDRTLASLPTLNENERQRDYWDDVLRGFGVRVSYGGRRAFVLRYRVKNRLLRLTLGPYPISRCSKHAERRVKCSDRLFVDIRRRDVRDHVEAIARKQDREGRLNW